MKEADEIKLKELNEAVEQALEERTKWLDSKMSEYAKVQVGEDIYDIRSGRKLGVVTRHYRYHTKSNPFYDDSLSVCYEYETSPRCFSNTSSQPGLWYGNKGLLIRMKEQELNNLK